MCLLLLSGVCEPVDAHSKDDSDMPQSVGKKTGILVPSRMHENKALPSSPKNLCKYRFDKSSIKEMEIAENRDLLLKRVHSNITILLVIWKDAPKRLNSESPQGTSQQILNNRGPQ
ncbi:hypothetical protein RRG08_008718 [Elysia crispata]|uniref:Uncharacterized protein n=1 Tax=Elysia crispata TaxID=231223 RepID=A0AAE0XPN7_9GAST|nr:hypothetical protein RRG08_008718 [Elysia crispata]